MTFLSGIAVYDGQLLDITGAKAVGVLVDYRRGVVHLNVDGVCVARVCRIEPLENLTVEVIGSEPLYKAVSAAQKG